MALTAHIDTALRRIGGGQPAQELAGGGTSQHSGDTAEHPTELGSVLANRRIQFHFDLGALHLQKKLPPICNQTLLTWFFWVLICSFLDNRAQLGNLGFTFPLINTLLLRAQHYLCFVQLQADKLLHASPVLHLGGAVGAILTWLAVGPLRLSHFFVHLGQSQPGARAKKQEVTDES